MYAVDYENFRATDLPADSLAVFLFALLAYDFCYYWQHRLGHEMNILWAAHVVHHSSEYYNLATALRQSSTGRFWLDFLSPIGTRGCFAQRILCGSSD